MRCECEVPAVVTSERGGEHTVEKEREEFGVLTMRNRSSSWQKKRKPLPTTEGGTERKMRGRGVRKNSNRKDR